MFLDVSAPRLLIAPLLVCLTIALSAATYAQALSTTSAGIQINMNVNGDAKIVTFAFNDAATGTPITTARPAAWMQLRRSEQASEELGCEAKAMQLSTGSLGARADVDLNTYRLVTLNEDSTVAFINPLVKLNNSRLESIVQLPSKGYDWVLSRRTQRLYISLRDTGQIAVIDALLRRLIKIIDLQPDALPTRMVMDDDADTVWVGLDGRNEVLALDAQNMQVKARVEVAAGLHTLALATGEPWVWVTNAQHGSVSIIHRTTLRKHAEVPVGKGPVSVAWSAAARRAVVLSIEDGLLSQVDPVSATVTQRIALERGVLQAALFDAGRYVLTINHRLHRASLIDLAASRVVGEASTTQNPDQIIITREFAYVRGQASPHVTLLALKEARAGKLSVATVSLGRKAPGDEAAGVNVALAMVLAPEGNGIYIANATDKTIYRYTEGLMAANGSFSNYARAARGLMVLDTSLAQTEAGVFSTAFAIAQPGRYDVVVRNANPAFVACFVTQIDKAQTPPTLAQAPVLRLQGLEQTATGEYTLRVHLQAVQGGLPEDATLLLFAQQKAWLQRIALQRDLPAGLLWAQLRVPEGVSAQEIQAMVSAPSQGLSFSAGYLGVLSNMMQQTLLDIGAAPAAAP
jgi:YVTN family beta-propeller protein